MAGTHIIDQRDSLGGSFTASLLVHAVVFAAAAGWTWYAQTHRDAFGDPNSAGGVTVVATEGIPIIQRTGPVNPVANDTESQVPDRPKPAARPKEVEDPDSIGITRTPKKKKKELTAFEKRIQENQRRMAEKDLQANQVYSTTGRAAVSPMFSQSSTGAGGLVGTGNPFGTRFGWYAQLVIQRISQKWRTEDVDARLQTANICSVSFDIQKDGSVRDVRIDQSSGNYAVDRSTERAVLESSPFPPLPDGFERKSARVQVNFQFKR